MYRRANGLRQAESITASAAIARQRSGRGRAQPAPRPSLAGGEPKRFDPSHPICLGSLHVPNSHFTPRRSVPRADIANRGVLRITTAAADARTSVITEAIAVIRKMSPQVPAGIWET